MLPLLMMTDSAVEMGKRFKNAMWIKVLGWISVLALTYLNLINMPASIQGFYGNAITASQTSTANMIAYVLDAAIIILLIWMMVELHKGSKRLVAELAAEKAEKSLGNEEA